MTTTHFGVTFLFGCLFLGIIQAIVSTVALIVLRKYLSPSKRPVS
jgi:hypothetical protein